MPIDRSFVVTRNRIDELFNNARSGSPSHASGGLSGLADSAPVVPAEAVDRFWGKHKLAWNRLGLRGTKPQLKPWMQYPSACLREFGLASLEFGAGSADEDRELLLAGIGYSLERISTALRIPRHAVGLGRRLQIVARPVATGAARYKVPGGGVQLRITFPPEMEAGEVWAGAFARQYAIALDSVLAVISGCSWGACYLTPDSATHRVNIAAVDGDLQKLAERVFDALYYTDDKENPWGIVLKGAGTAANRRRDVLARLVEKYLVEESEGEGGQVFFFGNKVGKGITSAAVRRLYPDRGLWDAVRPKVATYLREAMKAIARHSDGEGIDTPKKKHTEERKSLPTAKQFGSSDTGTKKQRGSSVVGAETDIETRTGPIAAHYALVELSDLLPSNDPITFTPSPHYPAYCQQRDYANDKAEQAKVIEQAGKFNPRFLLSDDPTAGNGPPICNNKNSGTGWIVLGGNSRTMTMLRAFQLNPRTITDYRSGLSMRLGMYGLTERDMEAFREPTLVRMIEASTTDENACATISRLLNANLTQEIDKTTETRSLAKELSADDLERIASAFEESGEPSFASALANKKLAKVIADAFDRRGIITRHNRSTWLTPDGTFTKSGRDNVEGTLLGLILPDATLVEAARSYTDKLLRSLPLLVRMDRLPSNWNLLPAIREAIRQESARRSSGLNKRDYLSSLPMFEGGPSQRVVDVWALLDAPAMKWRDAIAAYVRKAETEAGTSGGGAFGFDEAPQTPDDILMATKRKAGLADRISTIPTNPPLTAPPSVPRQRITFAELPNLSKEALPLPTRWRQFLHGIPAKHSMVIWGREGSGKSTLSMEWAEVLATFVDGATVLYATSEEDPTAGPMGERSALTRAYSANVVVEEVRRLADLDALLSNEHYDFVVVDSLTRMQAKDADAIALQIRHPQTSFAFVKHATSDGERPVGKELQYDVDTVIRVKDGLATTLKNRFGKDSTINVFTKGR